MRIKIDIQQGDCLDILKQMTSGSVDLIYLDPPFFTQTVQRLKNRDSLKEFRFSDLWRGPEDYVQFIYERILEMYRVLRDTGSIFVHCDRSAVHLIRLILEKVFGGENFRAEIIWSYRRWSNNTKGLLPAHQNILFYSKTDQFKFHTLYQEYSVATNVDQILQKRTRDKSSGKAVYAKTQEGKIISSGAKKGVPLSDVWEIPYLNPKASERVGYPTQKPLLLLERILRLASDPGDMVLDPFCGSGTTLVAAKLLGRNAVGIDILEEAVSLSSQRVTHPTQSESALLMKGRESYEMVEKEALAILTGLDCVPVQRNEGMDAILKQAFLGKPVPVRVQRRHETLMEAASKLKLAAHKREAQKAILVRVNDTNSLLEETMEELPEGIVVINSTAWAIEKSL